MTRAPATWAPPLREGVGASRVAVHGGPWPNVLAFLVARFPALAEQWPQRLSKGLVTDAAGQPLHAESPAPHGATLWYWRAPPPEPRVPFEIELLHRDEHLVVVDKPHFLATAPIGRHLHETALVRLRHQLGIDTLAPMHRLDLDTAGVLVFTVQPATRHAYHALLRDRQVHKVYEAVAPWRADLALPLDYSSRLVQHPGPDFMQMQTVAGEANAQTRIELIARLGAGMDWRPDASTSFASTSFAPTPFALACEPTHQPQPELAHYRLTPFTGRRHQLRAQMCALGLPILGDRIYPQLWPARPIGVAPDYAQPLQLLAREMAFTDPINGQPRRFVSRRVLLLAGGPVRPSA